MTSKADEKALSDSDQKIAIGRALGLSHEKLAETVGVSLSTVKRRLAESPVARLESIARTMLAFSESRMAEAAAEDVKARLSRILAKSLGASERVVDTAIESGDFSQLLQAHKVGEWAAKFEISEAPKRLEVDSTSKTLHVHVLSLEEAQNIVKTRELTVGQPLLPAAEVPEAELVS